MHPSIPAETTAKALRSTPLNRWRSPGLAISACVAAVCLGTPPARATGYLNDPATWSGATPCPNASGCVDSFGGGSYEIGGPETTGQFTITSPTATVDTFISFNYSFEPSDLSLASGGYSLDGSTYIPLSIVQDSSTGPLLLTAGNSFSFRLNNSGEQPILGVSNFNATGVPAPLPLLGAAAAFGAIRRRRATLRLRQSSAPQAASRHQ
jgi:hypothetical protein